MLITKRHMPYLIALVLVCCAGTLKMWSRVDEIGMSTMVQPLSLPRQMAGWSVAQSIKMNPQVHRILQNDGIDWNVYRRRNEFADLLVLYGHRKRTFHLPDSCLAGAGITIKSRHTILLRDSAMGTSVPFHALVLENDGKYRIALYTFVGPKGRPTDLLGLNAAMLMCRMGGQNPRGAALRVIGKMDPAKPLSSQSVCELAVTALREVGDRVEAARFSPVNPMINNKRI